MDLVYRYLCSIPADPYGRKLPAIFVQAAMEEDYLYAPLDDADCASLQTVIFYSSKAGKAVAERVAGLLQRHRVAVLYPADRDVVIHLGSRHRVLQVGVTRQAAEA